jgi:hypothetical protein
MPGNKYKASGFARLITVFEREAATLELTEQAPAASLGARAAKRPYEAQGHKTSHNDGLRNWYQAWPRSGARVCSALTCALEQD